MWKLRDPNQRLSKWKDFRLSLNKLDLETALQETVDFWCSPPWAPFYLDETDPSEWPAPWDLIVDNYFCDIAKALGIAYTIYLTEHSPEISIELYKDPTTGSDINIVLVNKKYVLNMNSGQVLNRQHTQSSIQLKYAYTAEELKIKTYK
jgi:hypothetical protein